MPYPYFTATAEANNNYCSSYCWDRNQLLPSNCWEKKLINTAIATCHNSAPGGLRRGLGHRGHGWLAAASYPKMARAHPATAPQHLPPCHCATCTPAIPGCTPHALPALTGSRVPGYPATRHIGTYRPATPPYPPRTPAPLLRHMRFCVPAYPRSRARTHLHASTYAIINLCIRSRHLP